MDFAPFQPVLVCNGPGDIWQKAFYDRKVKSAYNFNHAVIGGKRYRYCIPWDSSNDVSGQLVLEEPREN